MPTDPKPHRESTIASNHLMNLTTRPPAVMVRGQGSYLWDSAGRRYLDFVQGWAVNALGHAPPELSDAISRQARTLLNASPAYRTAPQGELADELATASGLDRVFFCNSGAEANEGAIKLARKWGRIHRGGAHEIITTVNGFHGRTLATMAASGKSGWDTMFPPAIAGFVKVPFGDVEAVRAAIRTETVGVLVEPIQGEGGVVMPPPSYLGALRKLTTETGTLLMLDEVQTGIGRTGTLFAYQHDGVLPDIMTLGKGLGGGIPLAALVASENASCFSPGEQGGTFNGNPLVTAAGLVVLHAVRSPGFLENVVHRGDELVRGLREIGVERGIVEVRGRGLLVAARLATPIAERVRDAAFELGLLVNSVRPDTLRFMPALNVSASEVEEMRALLVRALDAA